MKLFIARDKSGALGLSDRIPILEEANGSWVYDVLGMIMLDANMFSEVTFENSPREVELRLKD